MDFTGARLLNCDFTDTLIAGARFERAVIDRVGLNEGPRTDLRKAKDWEAYARGWVKSRVLRPSDGHLPHKAIFQDAPLGPEMVVIPAGEFLMGSDEIVPERDKRRMWIARRFALGRYPVTFEAYDAFLAAAAGRRVRDNDEADDNGWGRARRPVINVSWQDAQRYCAWLSQTTGLLGDFGYRLPSDSEWEYACRAGTHTQRWWGDKWDPTKANGDCRFEGGKTSPVGNCVANPWGLHDMIGNVYEWCADCWADNISELPADGAPFLDTEAAESSLRVLRAAPGSTIRWSSARPAAAGSVPTSATPSSASALPERFHRLLLDLLTT